MLRGTACPAGTKCPLCSSVGLPDVHVLGAQACIPNARAARRKLRALTAGKDAEEVDGRLVPSSAAGRGSSTTPGDKAGGTVKRGAPKRVPLFKSRRRVRVLPTDTETSDTDVSCGGPPSVGGTELTKESAPRRLRSAAKRAASDRES